MSIHRQPKSATVRFFVGSPSLDPARRIRVLGVAAQTMRELAANEKAEQLACDQEDARRTEEDNRLTWERNR